MADDLHSLGERVPNIALHDGFVERLALPDFFGVYEDVDVHCIGQGLHLMFTSPFTIFTHAVNVLFVSGFGNLISFFWR